MRRSKVLVAILIAATTFASGCRQPEKLPTSIAATPPASVSIDAPKPAPAQPAIASRDLSIDESMGGHTLSRHVGKTDAELRERLRREKQISAASTYTDRATAERVVGATLASGGERLKTWQSRTGRRPNLVLQFADRDHAALGRSLSRGQKTPVDASRALVVLRWDERGNRFYVLTSYPEADR